MKYWLASADVDVTISDYMVSELSDETYVPYVPIQTLSLNLGTIELNKIGIYQDYIYKNDGKWYKKEQIKKIVLGDIEQINNGTVIGQNRYYVVYREIIGDSTAADNPTYNNFIASRFISSNGTPNIYSGYTIVRHIVIIVDSNDTVTTVNQKFNGTDFYYQLKESEWADIEITDTNLISQLEAIDKAQSYTGTTIITSTYDSNNAQMIVKARALKGV